MTILPAQAHGRQFARNVVLYEHIFLFNELVDNFETFGFLEVDSDRTFVAISCKKVCRLWGKVW